VWLEGFETTDAMMSEVGVWKGNIVMRKIMFIIAGSKKGCSSKETCCQEGPCCEEDNSYQEEGAS